MKMKANGLVALLTDFGTVDWYVASIKAAAMVANPQVKLVDITHEVSPGAITEGAFVLNRCFNDFPAGTTFVVVIDPGVGTTREPIIVAAGDYFFVGPNNGVLYPTINQLKMRKSVQIVARNWLGRKKSTTFHGRDIFAPAGSLVASGASIEDAGPPATELVPFEFPEPRIYQDNLSGQILYFDRFGNGLTNILPKHVEGSKLVGLRGEEIFFPLATTFGEVEQGTPVSYWGSSGFLEVAIRDGNAKSKVQLSTESLVWPVFRP